MKKRIWNILLALMVCLAVGNSGSATIITVEVRGIVDSVNTSGGFSLDGSVGVGSGMTGFCTYDTNTPDEDPSEYHGRYPVLSLSMSIGNYIFEHNPISSDPALFKVWRVDISYRAQSSEGIVSLNGIPQAYNNIYIELLDVCNASSNGPDDALPVSFPDISFFNHRNEFEVSFSDSGVGFNISGELTSITVINEPVTYYVDGENGSDNNDGLSRETAFATIQRGIDAAFDDDTVLVADGIYTGEGNRDIDFKDKAITVKSENGPENCIIDCNGTEEQPHRGFYFHSDEDANSVLNGITITNGYATRGGAIYCRYSSPTITNCVITDNTAFYGGGGINCHWSSPTISNCILTNNTTRNNGGGIYNNYGNPTVNNCTIIGNSARTSGGGIRTYNGSSKITNCTIVENKPSGISGLNLTVTNSIIWDNSPYEIRHPAQVTYSNIKGGWEGEGNIDIDPGFAFSTDCHLIGDSACIDAGTNTPAGGLPARDIDGNPRVLDGDGDGNTITDIGAYEFNPNSPSIALSAIRFSYIQGGSELASQALLIRNCGGGTLNWEIAEDCDWLEAAPTNGVSTGLINEVILTADSNGLPIGDYSCVLTVRDANAINSPRTVTVDLRICAQVIYVPSQAPTIQYAIDYVFEGGTVIVEDGTYTGEGNRDIDFLGKPITVRSKNGPENCIIDCEGTEQEHHRGFLLTDCRSQDENQILSGFTVMNGHANSGGGICCLNSSATINNCIISGNTAGNEFGDLGGNGGGIYCRGWDDDIFTITNCIIRSNTAKGGWGAAGGGVCFGGTSDGGGSTFIMTNCTIMDNAVEGEQSFGGGVYCGGEGARYGDGDATFRIANCIISGNAAFGGGGIYCWESRMTINSCTISGNSAWTGGGIYDGHNSSSTINNCTIIGNSAKFEGGGMYSWYGDPNVTNCTFTGNSADEGGGIFSKASRTEITDSILWADIPTEIVNSSGRGSNIVLVAYSNVQNGWEGEGNIDADPCFVEAGFRDVNGTPEDANDDFWVEGDYHLQLSSLCIDAGDPCYVPSANETDLDGLARVFGGRIDMGAYEFSFIESQLRIFPQVINRHSRMKRIMAWLHLPEGVSKEQVDEDEGVLLYPGGIGPVRQYVFEHGKRGDKRVSIFAFYDKGEVMEAVIGNGRVELEVVGRLRSGRYFRGFDSVRINGRGRRGVFNTRLRGHKFTIYD